MSLWWHVTGDLNTALGHRHDLYSAPLLYAYAPRHHFAFLIQAELSNAIKGQHAHEPRKHGSHHCQI